MSGETTPYTVTTWLHELKAVALAAAAHGERLGRAGERRLYDVDVEPLGPAPANPDGTAALGPDDLADRIEW